MWDIAPPTYSGKKVNRYESLQLPAVHYCVSLIADSVATLPTDVFKGHGAQKKYVNKPSWLVQPNPYTTSFDFWHRILMSMLMDGNAFVYIDRDFSGSIKGLYVIDPAMVQIEWSEDYKSVRFITAGDVLTQAEIMWIPAFTMPGYIRGLSPLDLARQAVGLGLTAEEFGARFFGQGTAMSGVIQHPSMPTKDQVQMIKQTFKRTNSGLRNSHAVGILTGGATWQSISLTPDQAQFLETRKFQRTEIAMMYRVPAFLVDSTAVSSWGKGVEEQNKWFVDQTLTPWMVRIEQAVTNYLLVGNSYFKFNLDARLRAKTQERFAGYAIGVQNGFMSANQIAELEDWTALPGDMGDRYYRPGNLVPVTEDPDPKPSSVPDALLQQFIMNKSEQSPLFPPADPPATDPEPPDPNKEGS